MPGVINHEVLDSGRIIPAPVNRGFSKILNLRYNMVAAAGLNSLSTIAVPIDYFWVIEGISVENTLHAVYTVVYKTIGAVVMAGTPALNVWFISYPHLTMETGEILRCDWNGCTAGDNLLFWLHGRQIKTGLYL